MEASTLEPAGRRPAGGPTGKGVWPSWRIARAASDPAYPRRIFPQFFVTNHLSRGIMDGAVIVMPGNNTGIVVGWLAGRFPGRIGHLHSPRPKRVPPGPFPFVPYALDNGAFAKGDAWEEGPFFDLLDWAKLSGQRPLWVIVPDVVGDRLQTLRKWDLYAPRLERYGWPLAFAVQDGMAAADVPANAAAVFVGGTTAWKWATMRTWCGKFPRVHVGRVNSYHRLWECHEAGAESCDGTGWFRGDHGSGRPLRALCAYLEESTTGKRVRQMELIA